MKRIELYNIWESDYGDIRCNAILYENEIPKANVIASIEQDSIKENDVENIFEKHFLNNFNDYINLPKISECCQLLRDVYDIVCNTDASMCHVTNEDWDKYHLDEYDGNEFDTFQSEVIKYNLQDVIGINDCEYKIIGYSDLELKFNDDRYLKGKELEL